jgi:hypothetical protein
MRRLSAGRVREVEGGGGSRSADRAVNCGTLAAPFRADITQVSRLQLDQVVTLSLDEVPEPIACRVHDVDGPISRLVYLDELPPQAIGRLVLGAAGYVVFDEFRNPVGLRVAVRASPPYLDVAEVDAVSVPERRAGDRVKLVTRAVIIDPDGRPPESTFTIDLSETGALLRHAPVFDNTEQFGLELRFGDAPQPVTAQARIVRRTEDAVGVVFETMPARDARRLVEYLMGIRHQRRPASPN